MKALAIMALVAGGASLGFASDLGFELVNKTNRDFEAVYLSVSTDKTWHGNLLAEGRKLDPQETLQVKFPAGETAPAWDINIVDAEGLSVVFDDVKLVGVKRVTLTESDGKISADVE